MVAGARGFLNDLGVLNQLGHAVQVTGVRTVMDVPDSALFLVANPVFALAANQRMDLVIEYAADATAGPLTGIFEVFCDDPIDSIARIRFSTSIVANRHAELTFKPSSLDFPRQLVGTSVEKEIQLTNVGALTGSLAIEVVPEGAFSALGPASLTANAAEAVKVKYEPAAMGVANATLIIDRQSATDLVAVRHR